MRPCRSTSRAGAAIADAAGRNLERLDAAARRSCSATTSSRPRRGASSPTTSPTGSVAARPGRGARDRRAGACCRRSPTSARSPATGGATRATTTSRAARASSSTRSCATSAATRRRCPNGSAPGWSTRSPTTASPTWNRRPSCTRRCTGSSSPTSAAPTTCAIITALLGRQLADHRPADQRAPVCAICSTG